MEARTRKQIFGTTTAHLTKEHIEFWERWQSLTPDTSTEKIRAVIGKLRNRQGLAELVNRTGLQTMPIRDEYYRYPGASCEYLGSCILPRGVAAMCGRPLSLGLAHVTDAQEMTLFTAQESLLAGDITLSDTVPDYVAEVLKAIDHLGVITPRDVMLDAGRRAILERCDVLAEQVRASCEDLFAGLQESIVKTGWFSRMIGTTTTKKKVALRTTLQSRFRKMRQLRANVQERIYTSVFDRHVILPTPEQIEILFGTLRTNLATDAVESCVLTGRKLKTVLGKDLTSFP